MGPLLADEHVVPAGVSIGLGLLLIAAGILIWVLAQRGADGRLKKNWVAGIRTQATLRSDGAWLAAHKAGLGPSKLGALASVAAGLLLIAIRPENAGFVVLMVGASFLIPAPIIYGAVLGNRAAKEADQPER